MMRLLMVFFWSVEQLYHHTWLQVVDYGRDAWLKTHENMRRRPPLTVDHVQQFRQLWGMNQMLASWVVDKPKWKLSWQER